MPLKAHYLFNNEPAGFYVLIVILMMLDYLSLSIFSNAHLLYHQLANKIHTVHIMKIVLSLSRQASQAYSVHPPKRYNFAECFFIVQRVVSIIAKLSFNFNLVGS